MLSRILPAQFDNNYRGHKIGLWLFWLLTIGTLLMAIVVIVSADSAAQSADGIPLDTFGAQAAQTVIGAVALLGLYQFVISLLSLLALIRYRSMVPLLYLLIIVNVLGHRGIALLKPIPHAGAPSGYFVSVGLAALTLIGFVLSLQGPRTHRASTDASPTK